MSNNMTRQHLDELIEKRANANVQAKIEQFKKEIDAAVHKLFSGNGTLRTFGEYHSADNLHAKDRTAIIAAARLSVLRLAIQNREWDGGKWVNFGWPAVLWEIEKEAIEDDILVKMDLMKQLIMAPDRNTSEDVNPE